MQASAIKVYFTALGRSMQQADVVQNATDEEFHVQYKVQCYKLMQGACQRAPWYRSSGGTTAHSRRALAGGQQRAQACRGRGRTLRERRELEVADEAEQLLVRRGLAELAVGLGRVERVLALEADGLHDRVRDLLDADLLVLAHCRVREQAYLREG